MLLKFEEYINEQEYQEFLYFCELVEKEQINEALALGSYFGKMWEVIQSIVSTIGIKVNEILSFLKNKVVFNIFKSVNFSLTKLYELIRQGYEEFTGFRDSLAKYIAKHPLVQNVDGYAKWLDDFLKQYPILKKMSGAILAYMLFYIWMNSISFTGDPEFDFNIGDMWDALLGKKGFYDIFGGENGVKMLTFILTNKLGGLTFPWPGATSVQFVFALFYTIGRAIGKKIKWKKV